MKIYTYKNHLWFYKQDKLWPRVKAELKIFIIILAWIGLLALLAAKGW